MLTKRMIIMLAITGSILGLIVAWLVFMNVMAGIFISGMKSQPQTVSTTVVGYEEWEPKINAVGTMKAKKGTDITPQLSGIVSNISFESDSDVKEGDILISFADEDDVAKLKALEASADLARLTYNRSKELVRKRAVSQAQLDTSTANLKNAEAQVAAQQALVDKKQIRAPFDGHVGIRLVDIGQFLNAGQKVTTLQALDPIFIDFTLPQREVRLIAIGQDISIHTDAYPDQTFTGKVLAMDPKLDPVTRNISVRAELANPDRKLLPGMFASASITTGATEKKLTLPQTAITYNPYGETVFLVLKGEPDEDGKETLKAKQKFVKTGTKRGDQVAVIEGVAEGDTVVTSGQLKLKNDTPLTINNDDPLPNDAAPVMQDQ
ncbi:MAG: efflux RND transporter periplasmic adaptor subunit [Parvibaculum sp.]|nr:efflux RND transporter periplasmic adaptor subunit [Parvibaculum sp.]